MHPVCAEGCPWAEWGAVLWGGVLDLAPLLGAIVGRMALGVVGVFAVVGLARLLWARFGL